MCIFLMRGSLPWQSVRTKDRKDKHKALYKEKSIIELDVLCEGLPKEFANYLEKVRALGFDDEPNYDEYIHKFRILAHNINRDCIMDWGKESEVGLVDQFIDYKNIYTKNKARAEKVAAEISNQSQNSMYRDDSGSSIDDEGIGEEGTNVTNPMYKISKTPGMLMTSSTMNSKTMSKRSDYLDQNTDEFVPPHGEDELNKKMKALEFKVKRGINGHYY